MCTIVYIESRESASEISDAVVTCSTLGILDPCPPLRPAEWSLVTRSDDEAGEFVDGVLDSDYQEAERTD
jgi:hypothetical protein